MGALNQLHEHHATLQERVTYLEQLLHDSADKYDRELAAEKEAREVQAKSQCVKALQVWLNNNAAAALRLAFDGWAIMIKRNKAAALNQLHEHHATLQERVTYLEQLLHDSADKHDRELAAEKEAREAQAKSQCVKALQVWLNNSDNNDAAAALRLAFDRWATMIKQNKAAALNQLREHHGTLQERVTFLEHFLQDSAVEQETRATSG